MPPVPTFLGMSSATWLSVLTIVAIVAGPILALWAQRVSERNRETKSRRIHVFRELMATRGSRLSVRHVEALNAVEVEFYGEPKAKPVVTAWRTYLDNLNQALPTGNTQHFFDKRETIFIDLLYELAKFLGYKFEKLDLKNILYVPVWHGKVDDELNSIRTGAVEILTGKRPIGIAVWAPSTPAPPPELPKVTTPGT